ncbi:MAG: cytochrome c oxidase assembly protein [Cumulibacter sp.]
MGHAGHSFPMWMPSDPPSFGRLLAWQLQPIPVLDALCVLALVAYLFAVLRLRRQSVRWPLFRTVSFTVGSVSILLVVSTGIGGYSMQLFSVHMAQHMVLSMVAPVLLLLGAPVTLALRVLRPRGLLRRALVGVLHSRCVRFFSSGLVSTPLFVLSLFGLYFTSAFDFLMSSWWGHFYMLVHFIAVGLLYYWPILGVDPNPRRPQPLTRLGMLVIAMPFHAFFGIALMSSRSTVTTSLMAPQAWGIDAMWDQYVAGGIAWATGEIPALIIAVVIARQWARSETRLAKSHDRQADRDGDAALRRYNAKLAELAARASTDTSSGRGLTPT